MKGPALKKISGNAGALLLIQLANALLPLILAPYLTRTLGKEGYGLFAFGIALIQVATIITDYGFGLSAVYQIARAKKNPGRIKRIAGAVYASKLGICLLVVAALFIYPLIQNSYTNHREYFWLLSLSIIGISLQPIWLFQGIERMWLLTICVLTSRISFVTLTLLIVRQPEDLERVALINGITHLAAAAIAFFMVRNAGLLPSWPGFGYSTRIIRSSTAYFWSRLAVVSYGAGAIFFLGTFSSPTQIAFYSVAEQFYRGALAIYAPVTQAIYPYMVRNRDVALFKRLLKSSIGLAIAGIVLSFLFGKWLIVLIFGHEYEQSHAVFQIFMLALGAAIPSILLGYPFLGAMGNAKAANQSVLFAGLVQIVTLFMLWTFGCTSAIAVVTAVLIAEISALTWRIKCATPYLKLKA